MRSASKRKGKGNKYGGTRSNRRHGHSSNSVSSVSNKDVELSVLERSLSPESNKNSDLQNEYNNIVMALYNLYIFAWDFNEFIDKKVRPNKRNIFGIRTRRYRFKQFTLNHVNGLNNTIELIGVGLNNLKSELNIHDITLKIYRKRYKFLETQIMDRYNLIINNCKKLKEPKCNNDFEEFLKNHKDFLKKYNRIL
jgi:hypothetical protein